MKTHTLSLAIVGTLASSLVLSQAVLAEEVETSTEATSSEEVVSNEAGAETPASTASPEPPSNTRIPLKNTPEFKKIMKLVAKIDTMLS